MKNTLRTHREKLGYTQEVLAEAIGVAPRTYRNYERGTQIPNVETGLLLEQELGIPVQQLFTREDTTDET